MRALQRTVRGARRVPAPRTKNQEPRTKNQEPRTKKKPLLTAYDCTPYPALVAYSCNSANPIRPRESVVGELPELSKGELEVARVLWELGKATVRQVHEAFPDDRSIDFATVQTYLRRLHCKGYVHAELDGRVRYYSARVRPKTVIRRTVGDLVQRLFDGEAMPLMRHLIEEHGVTDKDLEQLRGLVDRLEKESGHERIG